ncbi:MAG: GGDEF domain-containing protein [Gammaproteobacteria bacterium]|nr:GGDEF domain-containing protein [Gammaproteobacteria bacterium]
MKRFTYLPVAAFWSLLATTTASAAPIDSAITYGGYGLAGVFFIILVMLKRQAHVDRQLADDTKLQLEQAEQAVSQLQVVRGELSQALSGTKAELVAAEEQGKESADMLAALRIQVERVARVDGLTGVANRQQFDISLADEIKRCVRERKDVSLLWVEIDSFVEFSAVSGEQKSEFVLQRVAQTISDSFRRAGDLVARVDHFKFAVLLPGSPASTAAKFAEKMRQSVYAQALPFAASDVADRVTVSVGVVALPPVRIHKSENAIAMAENALRDAQSNGYNQIAVGESVAA